MVFTGAKKAKNVDIARVGSKRKFRPGKKNKFELEYVATSGAPT